MLLIWISDLGFRSVLVSAADWVFRELMPNLCRRRFMPACGGGKLGSSGRSFPRWIVKVDCGPLDGPELALSIVDMRILSVETCKAVCINKRPRQKAVSYSEGLFNVARKFAKKQV